MIFINEGLLQVSFGRLNETRATPRYQWNNGDRGIEPFVIVQLTHQGEGIFELDGKSHRILPGRAFIALVPENSRYYYSGDGSEPWIFSWINFYGELAVHLWRSLRNQTGPVINLVPADIRLFRRLIERTIQRKWIDSYEASRAAYEFYLETLRHAPRSRTSRPFQEVISYFQAHCQDAVRMKEVAAHAGMSREHFTRLFSQEMGCGPAAFLRNIRLEAAARLLRTTDLPVTEVALRTGWTSATKLDLFFKRRYDISPRDYRKR